MALKIDASIIIPVYNEVDSLNQLNNELIEAIESSKYIDNYELIYVNDGSTDNSLEVLNEIKNDKTKITGFKQNRGKSAALQKGALESIYEIAVTIDSDLQDVPKEIDKLIQKKLEGFDLVSGYKQKRKDKFLVVFNSKILNKILSLLYKTEINDINSGYKILNKNVLNEIKLIEGFHRYIPLFFLGKGLKYTEVPVEHRARIYGYSKYSIFKALPSFFDLLVVLLITNKFLGFSLLVLIITIAVSIFLQIFNLILAVNFDYYILVLFSSIGLLGSIMYKFNKYKNYEFK